jgi:hypothetical protein
VCELCLLALAEDADEFILGDARSVVCDADRHGVLVCGDGHQQPGPVWTGVRRNDIGRTRVEILPHLLRIAVAKYRHVGMGPGNPFERVHAVAPDRLSEDETVVGPPFEFVQCRLGVPDASWLDCRPGVCQSLCRGQVPAGVYTENRDGVVHSHRTRRPVHWFGHSQERESREGPSDSSLTGVCPAATRGRFRYTTSDWSVDTKILCHVATVSSPYGSRRPAGRRTGTPVGPARPAATVAPWRRGGGCRG